MKKNIRKLFIPAFFGILTISLAIGACFSPYGEDEGTITINVANSGRTAVEGPEILLLSYEVTLDGPGGRRTVSFTGNTATVRVASGTYRIVVRAYGDRDYHSGKYDSFPPIMLRGRGVTTADIRPGRSNNVSIPMITALEIFNGDQLKEAVDYAGSSAPEIFIIKGSFTAPTGMLELTGGNNITLIAEESRTINMSQFYFQVGSGGTLTLGQAGMGGTLYLDGGNTPYPNALIRVAGGQLVMNDGVFLENRTRSTGNVGGVQVTAATGGTFTMNGGTIRNNTLSGGMDSGGGVHSERLFYMNDGIISGNTSDAGGGGVHIGSGGSLIKTGGVIYGNDVPEPLRNKYDTINSGAYAAMKDSGGTRNTTTWDSLTL